MRAGTGVVCLLLSIGVVGGVRAQDVPAALEAHGGFALPDRNGRRLLLNPDLAQPERLATALCGSRRVPVRFERRQVERANDGRQRSSNFDLLAGSVFTIAGDAVDPGAPCFLASDALLAGSTVLGVAADLPAACVEPGRFAALRDRPVTRCWRIARLGAERQVVLLEFERRGTDALASVALVDGEMAVFADFPAEFRGLGEDLWRVDDGGALSPGGIRVVCALLRDRRYVLGIAWAGAEGMLLSLWSSEGGDRFTKVLSDYWYQAPTDGPASEGTR